MDSKQAYSKAWKAVNKPKTKKYRKKYYQENKDTILEKAKKRPKKTFTEQEKLEKRIKNRLYMQKYRAKKAKESQK